MNGSSQNHEIILEIRRIGNVFRVAAIDTVTLKEVVFMTPANATKLQVQTLAKQKLTYINKRASSDS
jgi:hypothetical protein